MPRLCASPGCDGGAPREGLRPPRPARVRRVGDEPADAGARHRVRLRHREDREHPTVAIQRRRTHVRGPPCEPLVHLVAEEPQSVPLRQRDERLQCRTIEGRAQRVGGRIHDERTFARRDERLELREIRLEVALRTQRVGHGHGLQQVGVHRERGVAGIRHQHLVAVRQRECHREVQRLRGADGDPDLLRVDIEAVLTRELAADRLSQGRDTAIGRVADGAGPPGVRRGIPDPAGCDLARLADREDDRAGPSQRTLEDVAHSRAGHVRDVRGDLGHAAMLGGAPG